MTRSPGDSSETERSASVGWRSAAAFFAVQAALLLVAYRALILPASYVPSSLSDEIESWLFLSSSGSPGLVVALAVWVLIRRWPRLRSLPRQPGSPLLVAGCLVPAAALLGWASYARAVDLLAPSLTLAGFGLATLWGGAAARRAVALPLLMLLFAVRLPPPIYNAIVWDAQLVSARYAGWLLERIGVEATVSADLIFQDRHLLSVIEGCSGLRGAEILMLLSLLMKELFHLRAWETAVLFALSPAIAFALNGVRIAGVALLPNPDEAIQHTGQGILTLIGGCLLLFGVVLILERLRGRSPEPPARARSPAPRRPASRARLTWSTALIAGLALLSVAVRPAPPLPRERVELENLIPREVGRLTATDLEVPWRFLGQTLFRATLHRRYERPEGPKGSEIELFVGIGARDDPRFSSLSPKSAVPGPGWAEEEWSRQRSIIADAELDVVVVRAGTARRLVHRFTANDLGLMDEALRSLSRLDATRFGGARDEVVVRISTPLRNASAAERRQATARLNGFIRALDEPLRRLLGGEALSPPSSLQAADAS